MADARVFENRRRHVRVPVGLPVQIHIDDDDAPSMVELVDLAEGGVRFRMLGDEPRARLGRRVRFTFVVSGHDACSAEGRIARVHAGGELIVTLDRSNDAFRAFIGSLSSPA
jgi:hypothetical protein